MTGVGRSRLAAVGTVLVALLATLGACSSTGAASTTSGSAAPAKLTMWVRSGTAKQSQAMVDAYNASSKNHIDLTVIPNENYLQKVGVAAGSGDLPDLLTSDGVFTPNYVKQGLFADVTERLASSGLNTKVVKAQLDVGSANGKNYTVPHTVAISVLLQNNLLLTQAGIDPTAKITSLTQLADNAAKVAKLGGGVKGMYITGNNGGTIGFTMFPSVWASGGEVLNADGTKASLTDPNVIGVFKAYNAMYKAGTIAEASKNENGATRDSVFGQGTTGYMLGASSALTNIKESDKIKLGVQAIPGLTGGESTYVGGDVIGIAAASKNQAAAWDFLAWSLSDTTQVEVLAKAGYLVSRPDLANNKYSAADPRVVLMNSLVAKGRIPFALKYGQTFSDANGPWIAAARGALFGDDPTGALTAAEPKVNSSLQG
ncbi:MAG: extracellular solute-binding protein [Propionibacteriaceae bacterium]|nr:extracellular solute-binding protein [Micropruina sp.]HBX81065.1 sugar ABC transporter substrate-binding protein [Propionibacteriaceae bacterium]HBY24703.1 sugar ABC transporter substrate-binding protein [Propionibacteriaceae bacterium]